VWTDIFRALKGPIVPPIAPDSRVDSRLLTIKIRNSRDSGVASPVVSSLASWIFKRSDDTRARFADLGPRRHRYKGPLITRCFVARADNKSPNKEL
jgi:hypothetical protein